MINKHRHHKTLDESGSNGCGGRSHVVHLSVYGSISIGWFGSPPPPPPCPHSRTQAKAQCSGRSVRRSSWGRRVRPLLPPLFARAPACSPARSLSLPSSFLPSSLPTSFLRLGRSVCTTPVPSAVTLIRRSDMTDDDAELRSTDLRPPDARTSFTVVVVDISGRKIRLPEPRALLRKDVKDHSIHFNYF